MGPRKMGITRQICTRAFLSRYLSSEFDECVASEHPSADALAPRFVRTSVALSAAQALFDNGASLRAIKLIFIFFHAEERYTCDFRDRHVKDLYKIYIIYIYICLSETRARC